jgi:hypothetical protein
VYVYANVAGAGGTLEVGDYVDYTDLQLEASDDSTPTSYVPYHPPIELCKIGDYQDYIYKDQDGDWYLHKAIGNTVLSSTTGSYNSGSNWYYESFANIGIPGGVLDGGIMSNYFTAANSYSDMQTNPSNGLIANSANNIVIRNTACTNQASYRTWLAAHEVAVYYVLATATDTLITYPDVVDALNEILAGGSYKDTTYIEVTADDDNLPGLLTVTAGKE